MGSWPVRTCLRCEAPLTLSNEPKRIRIATDRANGKRTCGDTALEQEHVMERGIVTGGALIALSVLVAVVLNGQAARQTAPIASAEADQSVEATALTVDTASVAGRIRCPTASSVALCSCRSEDCWPGTQVRAVSSAPVRTR
jgi:hypothetical protein